MTNDLTRSISRRTSFTANGRLVYSLPNPIVENSEKIFVQGSLLSSSAYILGPDRKTIIFTLGNAPLSGETFWVFYAETFEEGDMNFYHTSWTPPKLYYTSDGVNILELTLSSGSIGAQDYSVIEIGDNFGEARFNIRLGTFQINTPNVIDIFLPLPVNFVSNLAAAEQLNLATMFGASQEAISYDLLATSIVDALSPLFAALPTPKCVLGLNRFANVAFPTGTNIAIYVTINFSTV